MNWLVCIGPSCALGLHRGARRSKPNYFVLQPQLRWSRWPRASRLTALKRRQRLRSVQPNTAPSSIYTSVNPAMIMTNICLEPWADIFSFVGDVCREQTWWSVTEVHPSCTVSGLVWNLWIYVEYTYNKITISTCVYMYGQIVLCFGTGAQICLTCRMMSTESANSFTLIGEAPDGSSMENLSRRLKVVAGPNGS